MGEFEGLTVGLVGCGRWGSNILRDLCHLGATVSVVVPDAADTDRIIELGAAQVTHDIDSLAGIDGIVVATPSVTHADVIDRCLDLGVPLFVEKPFTTDPARARAITARAPDIVFVMDKWRYHPGVIALRDLLSEGRLGALCSIETVRVQDGMPHSDVDCTWILLPHDLSIALEITGRHPVATSAAGVVVDGEIMSGDVRFDLGEGVDMRAIFGIDAPASTRTITVIGSEATATLAGGWEDHVRILPTDGHGDPVDLPTPGELPLLAELRCFLEHLRGGPAPRTSANDATTIVETIATIRTMIGAQS